MPDARQSPVLRTVYFIAGVLLVAVGFVGAFLPILPTTPFLILAAACFARSSRKLEAWLLNHRQFGPALQRWQERGAISRKAKILALVGATAGFLFFLVRVEPEAYVALAAAVPIIAGLAYVFTRPS